MSNIIGLNGITPPEPNGANPDIVEILEQYLDKARSGDLQAIGMITVHRGDHVFTLSRGYGKKHILVAGCEYLKHDLCAQ
jgi:hypothetical protein